MRNSQHLGHFRSNLSRVAVGRLLAAQNQIDVIDLTDSRGDRIRGRQHVGPGKLPVGQQPALVGAQRERFLQHRFGGRRPHRDHMDLRTGFLSDLQRRFHRVQIIRIHLRFNTVPL